MKVSRKKETIVIRGYMGKVEEREGSKIEHDEFDLYLVKSSKYWEVYEKKTGKSFGSPKTTKKEVMDTLEDTLSKYHDKIKQIILDTIEKDGYINEYQIGKWVKEEYKKAV